MKEDDWIKKPKLPNEPTGKCSKCGIILYGVMMYSCQRQGCPTFAQTTY